MSRDRYFELKMYAYCGMSYVLHEGARSECRAIAARFLRKRRASGYRITVHESGHDWELEEPEDSFMIPDDAGRLILRTLHV